MCVSFAWCVDDLNILLTCISSTPHGAATARSWSQCTERSTGSCVTHQSGWERLMPPATLRWLSTSRSGAFPPSSCESVCVLWVQVWVHESVCCGCRCGCMSLFVCCGCRCGCIIGGSCHKYHLCQDKSFVMTNVCCHGKICLLMWQKYACHDKTFVATKRFCYNKTFVVTIFF